MEINYRQLTVASPLLTVEANQISGALPDTQKPITFVHIPQAMCVDLFVYWCIFPELLGSLWIVHSGTDHK